MFTSNILKLLGTSTTKLNSNGLYIYDASKVQYPADIRKALKYNLRQLNLCILQQPFHYEGCVPFISYITLPKINL